MRKYLFAMILATTAATPALAQDSAPFSGLRTEGIIGYDTTDVEGENSDGITYGAQIGYDVQTRGAVFGVEGEIADSTIDECVQDVDVTGDQLCVEAGRDLYIGGRVGAAVSPRVLVYGKAGYTNARVRTDYEDGTDSDTLDFSVGENLDGVRVGGGVEFAVGPNSYAKTEYRYSNYEQGFDRHQVVAGFGFRF
ncbi:outer membrane protein [Sphingosinicella sp. CPCC 101087]|uniref:outer membrane protein n=1 Tax=Sphingosinicella sp. CPCC 101087 TaxID=2497754 RepID=UPI00101C8E5A|nr:outer membrane beta-barrel protein [Sphingosinicella sp. CPCC 101087]